jgi:flavin reductase (DIM6/NTAB) family NADH-FMN oxidoreductase RutF
MTHTLLGMPQSPKESQMNPPIESTQVLEELLTFQHTSDVLDASVLRQAFGTFPSGVVGVCALVDGEPSGLAASTFVPVSLDPPLVAICVQTTSNTWPRLETAPSLGISVLGASHDQAARQLAARDAQTRFDGLAYRTSAAGAVFIEDASAWIACSIHDVVAAGDHSIVLLQVQALTISLDVEPLVFHASAFRQLQLKAEKAA